MELTACVCGSSCSFCSSISASAITDFYKEGGTTADLYIPIDLGKSVSGRALEATGK